MLLLQDLRGQVLFATPSYGLVIAQALDDAGVDPASLALEVAVMGAEPWTEACATSSSGRSPRRAEHVRALGDRRPGRRRGVPRGPQRLARAGGPLPRRGARSRHGRAPVAPGEHGELVFTTLTKEALPLVRYRTGDIAALDAGACPCGRTFVRMGRVRGRRDDMLIIRGVNLYPSEVEHVLLGVRGAGAALAARRRAPGRPRRALRALRAGRRDVDRAALGARVERALQERIGVRMTVVLREPGGVPRSEGKAVRVVDRRPPA